MSDGGDPRSGAWEMFERNHVRPAQGRTLIVGSRVYAGREDRRKRYGDAIGIDMQPGPGVDIVANLEFGPPMGIGRFAHVECISVLEHSAAPWKLARTIERMMSPGATMFLSVPFVWRSHGYPEDYWRFTREAVPVLFPHVAWTYIRYAHRTLSKVVPGQEIEEFPFMPRTEVVAFGRRT